MKWNNATNAINGTILIVELWRSPRSFYAGNVEGNSAFNHPHVSLQWNLYNAATLGPEKSDLIIEVAALYLTSVKQPHNRLRIIDHFIQVPHVLNKVVFFFLKRDGTLHSVRGQVKE